MTQLEVGSCAFLPAAAMILTGRAPARDAYRLPKCGNKPGGELTVLTDNLRNGTSIGELDCDHRLVYAAGAR